jgi:hypothetical protein
MAPKYHPTPLSGGDRKALNKELGKARSMANILATRSAEMRAKGEAMIQQAATASRSIRRPPSTRPSIKRCETSISPQWFPGYRAFDLLRAKYRQSRPIIHLLSNIVSDQKGLPSELGTPTTPLNIAGQVLGQYKRSDNNNHGIRISNILRILLPIGVRETEIDSAWLSTTDGFGAKREATEHSASITYTIDPQDDFQTVSQIMNGVRDLDLLLNQIKKTLR